MQPVPSLPKVSFHAEKGIKLFTHNQRVSGKNKFTNERVPQFSIQTAGNTHESTLDSKFDFRIGIDTFRR